MDRQARALADAFAMNCSLATPVRWHGVRALVFSELDEAEHQRRQSCAIGAVRDYHTLKQSYEQLLGISPGPPQLVLPLEGDQPDPGVPRLPLSVDSVVVMGKRAAATIRRASSFAPLVGRRIAVLASGPRRMDDRYLDALWFDVGVAILDPHNQVDIVVQPGERALFNEVYRWWFAEAVYQVHLNSVGAPGPARARPVKA